MNRCIKANNKWKNAWVELWVQAQFFISHMHKNIPTVERERPIQALIEKIA